ncbi:putative non-specific serine/threonine protein kinase [Helianthus annuus]|nr:putative non-specific serine/threonine protein kinase [Helianthus annuus]
MSHARCLYNRVYRKTKAEKRSALLRPIQGSESRGALAAGLVGITIDKAVEFSYEELSKATNDFSLGNKIGQGGFGVVYYAELRGEVWN